MKASLGHDSHLTFDCQQNACHAFLTASDEFLQLKDKAKDVRASMWTALA
jgi:hypothetical protein